MFLENDFARPLFDFEKGGKPSAYKCLCMKEHGYHCDHPDCTPCNKITRTERGMRMHLKTVHGWEEQACLYSTEPRSIPSQRAEEMRRQGLRNSPRKEEPKSTESIQRQPRLAGMSDEELQKPTREEK